MSEDRRPGDAPGTEPDPEGGAAARRLPARRAGSRRTGAAKRDPRAAPPAAGEAGEAAPVAARAPAELPIAVATLPERLEPESPVEVGSGWEEPSGPARAWRWSGLTNVFALAGRELGAYFTSPIAYVVGAVIILPVSWLSYLIPISLGSTIGMDGIFALLSLLMVFLIPIFTMRLLAEERRSGTIELLLTSPVRDWEVVTGKWLGATVFFLATIAFTLVYLVLISVFQPTTTSYQVLGHHLTLPGVDYGTVLTNYIGIILLGATWTAIGVLCSSLTSNQIIAAVIGIVSLLTLQYVVSGLAGGLSSPWSDFAGYVSSQTRALSFTQGRLVLPDLIYFVTMTFGALFLATRVLEARRWR